MKFFFISLLISIFFFYGSCKKDSGCKTVSPEAEAAEIMEYNIKNAIGAQQFSNSIYYKIIDAGTGVNPVKTSKVVVTYSGKLLSNAVFDSIATSKTITLTELIEGWQIGLPLVKKGGRIILIIPSAYAYGCNGNGNYNVPSNAILLYDIRLIDVL